MEYQKAAIWTQKCGLRQADVNETYRDVAEFLYHRVSVNTLERENSNFPVRAK